jgi:hypothetical protein
MRHDNGYVRMYQKNNPSRSYRSRYPRHFEDMGGLFGMQKEDNCPLLCFLVAPRYQGVENWDVIAY